MRMIGFATLLLLTSIACTAEMAAAGEDSQIYLAVDPSFVQYVSISITGNVATGFLEVIHYDEKATGALDRKQIALSGLAQGRMIVFGTWIVDDTPQQLVITYPAHTGALREARFQRSSISDVNRSVDALTQRALRTQVTSESNDARREIAGALALAAADTVAFARLQIALGVSIVKRIAAKQQADQAATVAKAQHVQAEAAVQAAKDSGSVRAAALQVQAAMYVDVAAARAQAYLTQAESDVASGNDDLTVLKGHIGASEKRIAYLRGVITKEYGLQSSTAGSRLKRNLKNFSPARANLGIIIDP